MYYRKFDKLEEKEIINYLNTIKYTGFYKKINDIEITSIDQKCTFDILKINCEILVHFYEKNIDNITINLILDNEFAKNIFEKKTMWYGKASISNKTTREYDKVFSQILEMLSYTEIIEKKFYKRSRVYNIKNIEIIKKLSSSEDLCVTFICHHVYLLIKDEKNIVKLLEKLKLNFNKNDLKIFKELTINWIYKSSNFKHKSDNSQISQKINNPLFYLWELKKYNQNDKINKNFKDIEQSIKDLSYFRIHKRDKSRIPMLTRYENKVLNNYTNNKNELSINKIKENIYSYNNEYKNILGIKSEYLISEMSYSELEHNGHIHHIWPKSYWNNDCENSIFNKDMNENLILLSYDEHNGIAHKNGNTSLINLDNLRDILWSQYFKIRTINNYKMYDPIKFYKLCCMIYDIKPINIDNIEILSNIEKIWWYIEDVLSQKL